MDYHWLRPVHDLQYELNTKNVYCINGLLSSKVIEDAITACISRDQEIFQLYETAVPLMITASTNTNSATLSPTTTARTPVLSPTATATATGRHTATPTAATTATATSTIESMQSQTQIESSSPQYSINQNISNNEKIKTLHSDSLSRQ